MNKAFEVAMKSAETSTSKYGEIRKRIEVMARNENSAMFSAECQNEGFIAVCATCK